MGFIEDLKQTREELLKEIEVDKEAISDLTVKITRLQNLNIERRSKINKIQALLLEYDVRFNGEKDIELIPTKGSKCSVYLKNANSGGISTSY